ncbi:hypothetical protein HaLaN_13106, partial [Haematococcus lacustris]
LAGGRVLGPGCEGCWPFTAELTQLVWDSSTSTT